MYAGIYSPLTTFTACECLLSSIISDALPPYLDQFQQRIWYDLGATQEMLHQMRICLSQGLPATASPPRAESPPPSRRPAAAPIHPYHGENLLRPQKVRAQAPGPRAPMVTTSPRTEKKKRRMHKSTKRTVTSEMVSPPEKKRKIISESPDSQAEGPFCDLDTVSVPEDSPHAN